MDGPREKIAFGRAPVQWPSARTGVSRIGAGKDCRPSAGSRRTTHLSHPCAAYSVRQSSGWKIAWPLLLNPLAAPWSREGRPAAAAAQPLAALPLTDAACPLRASGTRGKRSWSNAPLHPDDLRTIRHGTAVSISQKTQACPKARQNRSRHRYADPRTATLHTRAKLRLKAAFSFGPSTARFLFRKTEKKMGGGMGKPPSRLDPLPISHTYRKFII